MDENSFALSLVSILEIIKRGDAIGFGPDTNRAIAGDVIIVQSDILRAIKEHLDGFARELHAQRVPLLGGDRSIDIFDGEAPTFLHVIKRHVVFERVATSNVVLVAV